MEKTFSQELIDAVRKVSKTRDIPLIETLELSSSEFQETEERNKIVSPTICYVLSNGNCVEKLTQEKRKALKEFAAIVDVKGAFFMVVFVYKD